MCLPSVTDITFFVRFFVLALRRGPFHSAFPEFPLLRWHSECARLIAHPSRLSGLLFTPGISFPALQARYSVVVHHVLVAVCKCRYSGISLPVVVEHTCYGLRLGEFQVLKSRELQASFGSSNISSPSHGKPS